MKPPELKPPTTSATTRERDSPVAQPKNSVWGPVNNPPKSGYGFVEAALNTLREFSGPMATELEKNHQQRGRRGYPATDMLCVYALQFLQNIPFNGCFLADLNRDPRLLKMCGMDHAPSEATFCRFRKKMKQIQERLASVHSQVVERCDVEIERLRDTGIVPKNAPRLGEYLALDPTDIEASARYRSEHCDALESADCTRHSKKPCSDPSARWGYRTPKGKSGRAMEKDGEELKEKFFGHKNHVIADGCCWIPLHSILRPANVHESPHFAEDLDATLARYPWFRPH